jgi:Fe-S-cluster containining protein
MDTAARLRVLKQIYAVYEDFSSTLESVCERCCDTCCTCNVTVTTLEGLYMLENMDDGVRCRFFSRLSDIKGFHRFRPKLSMNRMAVMCAEGEDFPEDQPDPACGACPFLEDRLCPVYPIRPFGCRCMVSKTRCADSGFAETDDLVVSVNTIFMQVIEHVDRDGCFGNMLDVLSELSTPPVSDVYIKNSTLPCHPPLTPNFPLKILMCPPEHRKAVEPILNSLSGIAWG